MENQMNEKLKFAGLLALGWMCAKDMPNDPVIQILAKTLKEAGVEGSHLEAILAAGAEKSE